MRKPTFTTRMVCPRDAQRWLTNNLYQGQRAFRPAHAQWLLSLMRNGHFRDGSVVTFGVLDGKHYLVNGQHTLAALAQYGQPLELTIEDHPVASESALAALYATFDRNLARTHADIYTAHGFGERHGLNKKASAAVSAAMTYVLSGFDESGADTRSLYGQYLKDGEFRYAAMETWATEAVQYFGVCSGINTKQYTLMYRAAIVAVGLVCFRFAPHDQAVVFWSRVAQDDGLTAGMPERTLLQFLRNVPPEQTKRLAYSRYAAAAWNAACEGRPLHKLYARDLSLPILIAQTPHDGTQVYTYIDAQGQLLRQPQVKEA